MVAATSTVVWMAAMATVVAKACWINVYFSPAAGVNQNNNKPLEAPAGFRMVGSHLQRTRCI